MPEHTRLIYVHDPMCSWCWGFRPTFERLCGELPGGIDVVWLLGGLAPDSDQPMPPEMQARLQDTWRRIQQRIPGTRFNFDFWRDCRPRRSTWPACRAVIAARTLEPALETDMVHAIQRAYYLEARNPSDPETLARLARELGLDVDEFSGLLDAPKTQSTLREEIEQSRRLGVHGFPSLRLQIGESHWPVPVDYTDAGTMLETIRALFAD
jgi:putative protein-disulfide isomerase